MNDVRSMTPKQRCEAFQEEYQALCAKWGVSHQIHYREPQVLIEPSGLPLLQAGLVFLAQATPGWTPPPEQKPETPKTEIVPIAEAPAAKEPAAK